MAAMDAGHTRNGMKRIRTSFIALPLILTLLWWLADPVALFATSGFFPWRSLFVQYSGILAFGSMTAAIVLAARSGWIENRLGGLDKMYRLHKWLGIAALVLAVLHWLGAQGPKWLVGAGLIERPARGAPVEQTVAVFTFLQSQRGFAEQLGEWAFYAAALLIFMALVKWFPYKYFFKLHRLLAAAYLVLVVHAVFLLRFDYWTSPLGVAMAAMAVAGSTAALMALFGHIGARRRVVGLVEEVDYLSGVGVNRIIVWVDNRWGDHAAGQFAFVTFDPEEGPHPFTIASNWEGDGRLAFFVKGLGDYTKTLSSTLKRGDMAIVEGPYGRFNFEGDTNRQIWVGAGIGITPFIGRMQTLAGAPDGRTIDFFHTTADVDEDALNALRADAKAAGIRLHILIDSRDGFLTGERLRQTVPD